MTALVCPATSFTPDESSRNDFDRFFTEHARDIAAVVAFSEVLSRSGRGGRQEEYLEPTPAPESAF